MPTLTINASNRTIEPLPADYVVVQTDKDSSKIIIKCPKALGEGITVASTNVFSVEMAINDGGYIEDTVTTDFDSDTDYVIVTWMVDSQVTSSSGTAIFRLIIKNSDKTFLWGSLPQAIKIYSNRTVPNGSAFIDANYDLNDIVRNINSIAYTTSKNYIDQTYKYSEYKGFYDDAKEFTEFNRTYYPILKAYAEKTQTAALAVEEDTVTVTKYRNEVVQVAAAVVAKVDENISPGTISFYVDPDDGGLNISYVASEGS